MYAQSAMFFGMGCEGSLRIVWPVDHFEQSAHWGAGARRRTSAVVRANDAIIAERSYNGLVECPQTTIPRTVRHVWIRSIWISNDVPYKEAMRSSSPIVRYEKVDIRTRIHNGQELRTSLVEGGVHLH